MCAGRHCTTFLNHETTSHSQIKNLSLSDFILLLRKHCNEHHNFSRCQECPQLLKAAKTVIDKGIISLSSLFKTAFPGVTYTAYSAKRRLSQLPLVTLCIGSPSSGTASVVAMEYVNGVDYVKLAHFLTACATYQAATIPSLSKSELQQLLSVAQTDKERELIRYTAYKASGLSKTGARKYYGFEDMTNRLSKIQKCFEDIRSIRECIDELGRTQERGALKAMGISENNDCTGESSVIESEMTRDDVDSNDTNMEFGLDIDQCYTILKQSEFNWFSFVEKMSNIEEKQHEKYYSVIMSSDKPLLEKKLIELSHQAYVADLDELKLRDREAAAFNGEIVSDSEKENPDVYLNIRDLTSDHAHSLIAKTKQRIRRKVRYLKTKYITERKFLSRKISEGVRGILKELPNIGEVMEKFVEESNIGADAWRRTGVLTFDGNTRVKRKVTYERIRRHLISVFKRNFSYGTVVQLCVARNLRRRSAQRYRGVAKITSRRARRGFQLKYNPDSHWSAAMYRTLNVLQYTDGVNIININRDDAAGFRLDTMATHRLHQTPVVRGKETLTTYTDYVNRYKAVLQTTSYHFAKTKTTSGLCVGVVKATGMFNKNPVQHAADLEMLEEATQVKSIFHNFATGERKLIECVRVDGAVDEGPSHEEVQFLWSVRHLFKPTYATLVTARSSGSSYLNRVELQNGCLALAHANLFIPSTLNGSCIDINTGKVDREKYIINMELATDVYISRVNGAPCGDGEILLFKGADSRKQQAERKFLITYLKGSKLQKEELKLKQPALYNYFDKVWTVRNNHMKRHLPSQYIFFLSCCFDKDCSHPICSSQKIVNLSWFDNGPSITYLPLPIPDPSRPWGHTSCSDYESFCSGHFLPPAEAMNSNLTPMIKPPNQLIKEAFESSNFHYPPTDDFCLRLARECLLSINEVKMWVDHLYTIKRNCMRGAAQAAKTKELRNKDQSLKPVESVYYCGVCKEQYQEYTKEVERWDRM